MLCAVMDVEHDEARKILHNLVLQEEITFF